MKLLTAWCLIIAYSQVFAQLNTLQSSPDIIWKELDTNEVKIYFPSFLEEKAQKVAGLLAHYKKYISKEYQFSPPEKFTLILRSEYSQPNGFVALAPRRSEWYSFANITPVVGSLEWYQALAVHEYRHVAQFDYVFQGYNSGVMYVLFGEFWRSVATAMTAPSWFFEGDAVWAETVHTDAGRGRSPRFSARMLALLDHNYLPSFDTFLARSYEIPLPNHYVYGYFLTTYAYLKFGKEVWQRILRDSSHSFPTPYRFYNSFERITGQNFESFYNETFSYVKEQSKKQDRKVLSPQKMSEVNLKNYVTFSRPIKLENKLYIFRKDLDSFWNLLKITGNEEENLGEFNISAELSRPDIKRDLLVYTQILPDKRFSHKAFSDLFFVSLDKKNKKSTPDQDIHQLSSKKRYYHPKIHPELDQVFVVHFNAKNEWEIDVLDFKGKKINTYKFKELRISEFVFKDADTLLAVAQDTKSMKTIIEFTLSDQTVKTLTPYTRNNLFALNYNDNHLYFEADYKGKVENFALNTQNFKLKKCSHAKFANFDPYVFENKRYFIDLRANGLIYQSTDIDCQVVDDNALFSYTEYIGDGPADNFTKTQVRSINLSPDTLSKKSEVNDYQKEEDLFNFHSWSFIGGRGLRIQGQSNNYLNDIYFNAELGEDAQERRPYSSIALEYAKYYPILGVNLYYSERNVTYSDETRDNFYEGSGSLYAKVPYFWRDNFYDGSLLFNFSYGKQFRSSRSRSTLRGLNDDDVNLSQFDFSFKKLKSLRFRELIPSRGLSYSFSGVQSESTQDERLSNFLIHQELNLYFNSFFKNHGFKLSLEEERQRDSFLSYDIERVGQDINEYKFSRGFAYRFSPYFFKSEINYTFPLLYTDWQLKDYLYINRVYSNIFFDHTRVTKLLDDSSFDSLNSLGQEFYFESLTFRILPVTYGIRLINNLNTQQWQAELLLSLGVNI